MEDRFFTLTSSVGNFVFKSGIPLSKAKLIRDTLMGAISNPQDGVRIKSEQQCMEHTKKHFRDNAGFLVGVNLT